MNIELPQKYLTDAIDDILKDIYNTHLVLRDKGYKNLHIEVSHRFVHNDCLIMSFHNYKDWIFDSVKPCDGGIHRNCGTFLGRINNLPVFLSMNDDAGLWVRFVDNEMTHITTNYILAPV